MSNKKRPNLLRLSPDICSLRAKSLGLTSTMSSWASDLLGHAGRALEAVSTATAKKDEPKSVRESSDF